jgi:hypothetical protein
VAQGCSWGLHRRASRAVFECHAPPCTRENVLNVTRACKASENSVWQVRTMCDAYKTSSFEGVAGQKHFILCSQNGMYRGDVRQSPACVAMHLFESS